MYRSRKSPRGRRFPEKYLESIVKLLVQNNVLIGVRGKGGGYRLNGTPDQFTVRKILEITEGQLAPSPASANRMSRAPAW